MFYGEQRGRSWERDCPSIEFAHQPIWASGKRRLGPLYAYENVPVG